MTRARLAPRYLGPSGCRGNTGAPSSALPASNTDQTVYRPPTETPGLQQAFTPNDEFFVLAPADIPEIGKNVTKISGDGAGAPIELTLDQLTRDFEQVESPVCNARNRRGCRGPTRRRG
jgi:hypothetical protein